MAMAMAMANPECETEKAPLQLDFDHYLKLEFYGFRINSDAGLLAFRELDDAFGLTGTVGEGLVDPFSGKNGQHAKRSWFREAVFGRRGGHDDVNDADRLDRDTACSAIIWASLMGASRECRVKFS